MSESTKQMDTWSSGFGKSYTDRNPQTIEEMDSYYTTAFGVTRSELNEEFLGGLDRSLRILEVGANVGAQLGGLQKMGFTNLYGIELQPYAVERAGAQTQNINLIQGTAFDIPFKDGFFDLVYTSGVLIHISPDDIGVALSEICRCSRRYVWGFEYFADTYQAVPYRGREDLLWKTDFAQLYLDKDPSFREVKKRTVKYLTNDNHDCMYLLDNSEQTKVG